MAKEKSVFQQVSESIKAGATAIVDVAQAALTASSELPNDGGYKPVKNQRWVQEIEANKPRSKKKASKNKSEKKSAKKTVKKAAKKAVKKIAKKTAKKSKKKSKKKKL